MSFCDENLPKDYQIFVGSVSFLLLRVQPDSREKKMSTLEKMFRQPSPGSIFDVPRHATWMLKMTQRCCFSLTSFMGGLIYLERLRQRGKITLFESTWRSLWVASMIISEKWWEDNYIHPGHILNTYGSTHRSREFLDMQMRLFEAMHYKLEITKDELKRWRTRLRSEMPEQSILSMVPFQQIFIPRPIPNLKVKKPQIEKKPAAVTTMNSLISLTSFTDREDESCKAKAAEAARGTQAPTRRWQTQETARQVPQTLQEKEQQDRMSEVSTLTPKSSDYGDQQAGSSAYSSESETVGGREARHRHGHQHSGTQRSLARGGAEGLTTSRQQPKEYRTYTSTAANISNYARSRSFGGESLSSLGAQQQLTAANAYGAHAVEAVAATHRGGYAAAVAHSACATSARMISPRLGLELPRHQDDRLRHQHPQQQHLLHLRPPSAASTTSGSAFPLSSRTHEAPAPGGWNTTQSSAYHADPYRFQAGGPLGGAPPRTASGQGFVTAPSGLLRA